MTKNDNLKENQYANMNKFNARIYLHAAYSTNKYPWPIWIYDQFEKKDNMSILELGCGTGLLWQVNAQRLPESWKIIVSDFSEGMLNGARNNIKGSKAQIDFKIINAENIEILPNSFDSVIANHMLYHIPNRKKAFGEIIKVLKNDGVLYASTIGEDNMFEMKEIVNKFNNNTNYSKALGSIENNFSLNNGKKQLEEYFNNVSVVEYKNSLKITEAEPIVNYLLSCNDLKPNLTVLESEKVEEFTKYISDLIAECKFISVRITSGMFIAKKK